MPTSYTGTWMYIGTTASPLDRDTNTGADPVDGNPDENSENAGQLLGQVYDINNSSLHSVSYTNLDDDLGNAPGDSGGATQAAFRMDHYQAFTGNNRVTDEMTYNLGAGPVTSKFDAYLTYNATIQYFDVNSVLQTATGIVSVVQLQDGTTWISGFNSTLDNRNIQTVTINSINDRTFSYFFGTNWSIDNSRLVTCFTAGTRIRAAEGEVLVETIAKGDLILTKDRGLQPVRWIGRTRLDRAALQEQPKLRPIRIAAGALGPQHPETDLIVSPQHRILVRSRIAQRMFGTDEVLVAAKQLLALDGVEVVEEDQVEYLHILFDQHEIVYANGAETESLFTGPEALKAVGPAARDEIMTLFPELADADYRPNPARPLAIGHRARRLIERQIHSGQVLAC